MPPSAAPARHSCPRAGAVRGTGTITLATGLQTWRAAKEIVELMTERLETDEPGAVHPRLTWGIQYSILKTRTDELATE